MERDRGDMRSAITDLQILTGPKKSLTQEDTALLSNRDRTEIHIRSSKDHLQQQNRSLKLDEL